jgi:single-stranded-DNA-specific exonuclease
VPLDHNNRILVAAGLRRLRTGACQPGVRALAQVAGRELATLAASDIGFALAPRLNAAGRLDDMSLGIACLLADDDAEAERLAGLLHAINGERRELQRDMLEQAEQRVAALLLEAGGSMPAGVCVHDAGWHPGVVGLIASRLKDRLHRPVVAFAPGGDDGLLRGSARSIPGVHVRDVLADVACRHPDLLQRFGGHAMAAGLSLAERHLGAFSTAFAEAVGARLDPAVLLREILSDGELTGEDFCRPLADALRFAGPWGQGFPEPLFDGEFAVREWRCVGGSHLRMRVQPVAGGGVLSAIEFGGWDGQGAPAAVRLAYQLEPDDWRGNAGVQLLVRHREAL